MSDLITPELFDHLVSLAALELDADEAEYLRGQLNNQLKVIQELREIPIPEDVQPAAHGVPFPPQISPKPRTDSWIPYQQPEEILAQAPQVEDRYIVVPDIPHTELE
ncbi:MAG TPA: Asp-tRNA(Asn)/Glu-tRNA(Gln) amidotransferase subunit GatC [Anaerolineaceae bacterium]|nr:Asp-tRNA(Asn)/Glu-tRNA(Gln) amidotransferase subunit GatC [Anaerolineaceae bacterium]